MKKACDCLQIQHGQFNQWKKNLGKFFKQKKTNPKTRFVHSGHALGLDPIKDYLLAFILELRDKGMGVTPQMVIKKLQEFKKKYRVCQYKKVDSGLKSQCLVHCSGTRESQRTHEKFRKIS